MGSLLYPTLRFSDRVVAEMLSTSAAVHCDSGSPDGRNLWSSYHAKRFKGQKPKVISKMFSAVFSAAIFPSVSFQFHLVKPHWLSSHRLYLK